MLRLTTWIRKERLEDMIGKDAVHNLCEKDILRVKLRYSTQMHMPYYEFIKIKDIEEFNKYIKGLGG